MNSCFSRVIRISKTIHGSRGSIVEGREHVCRNWRLIPSRHLASDDQRAEPIGQSDQKDLVKLSPREVLEREFPEYYSEGKFVTRISYIDFVDQALERLKEIGLERDLNSYKELLKVFPPGKYCPKSVFDFGLFHAPQQLCGLRILHQMDVHGVIPDKETERIIVERFSNRSQVWMKCCRMNFWFMKMRNLDPNPLPEVIPKRPHELARVALVRMLNDSRSLVAVTNTSSLPDSVDKTWLVYSQSPTQKDIIERLDENTLLYIEDAGLTYVQDKYLSYFVLKVYDSEESIKERRKEPEPDYDYNRLKMKFYGKPIREKIKEFEELHYDGSGYVLSIAITGTSSQDSVLSWLKILQRRNPKLSKMNVLFKLERPTVELMDTNNPEPGHDDNNRNEQKASN